MPILQSCRLGALRLALAGAVLVLAPAAAEAYTQRSGGWHGYQAQRMKPVQVTKRPAVNAQPKNQSKTQPKSQAKAAQPKETAAAAKPADHAGAWTAGEGGRACFRSRRKLWHADEGWVVKKVNVCP